MTVAQAFVGQVKPGKYDDALEMAQLAKKVLERHGAKHIRLMGAALGLESSSSLIFSTEFDTMQAYGKANDAWVTSPQGQAMGLVLNSSDAPVVMVSHEVFTELPL